MTDNPHAFPSLETENAKGNDGMTLRDYFAAAAMQGIICNPSLEEVLEITDSSATAICPACKKGITGDCGFYCDVPRTGQQVNIELEKAIAFGDGYNKGHAEALATTPQKEVSGDTNALEYTIRCWREYQDDMRPEMRNRFLRAYQRFFDQTQPREE